MDATYRFRFLIYLAAFMLVMSLCFVYAEPLPSQNPLLFQISPQHADFLAPLQNGPTFDPAALRATTPILTPGLIRWVEQKKPSHHGLFHRSRQTLPQSSTTGISSESSMRGLTLRPSVTSSTH
jgi:hypothetical protein